MKSLLVALVLSVASVTSAGHIAEESTQVASSMKWFEKLNTAVCKPSPVNRLVRPTVCLGFETGMRLMASN